MTNNFIFILAITFTATAFYIIFKYVLKVNSVNKDLLKEPFPEQWRAILNKRVMYYRNLEPERKKEFEKRIKRFLAEKKIIGVDTDVTDLDKLLVASSAVIPVFNFPYFNYPNVREILLYPHSFDKKFNTDDNAEQRNILGMVGDGFMNGSVVISKPDLEAAFDGRRHKRNVGIHEFVHLIDKADGAVDGIPEILFDHSYVFPWLKEVKREIFKIKKGKSDIDPYAITNDAEFLAVVSEYFFDDPESLKRRHQELYGYLSKIFKQDPEKYV
jgi:Mlc titration factor MtfA (ptsG expression regulator)